MANFDRGREFITTILDSWANSQTPSIAVDWENRRESAVLDNAKKSGNLWIRFRGQSVETFQAALGTSGYTREVYSGFVSVFVKKDSGTKELNDTTTNISEHFESIRRRETGMLPNDIIIDSVSLAGAPISEDGWVGRTIVIPLRIGTFR